MEDTSPFMHRRTISYLSAKLEEGGLERVESDPDVFVTYHTNEREEMQLNTTSFGYGYGGGWYRSPYWRGGWGGTTSTTRVQRYTKGTLVVDIWDAETKNLVWRGTVEGVVPDDPQDAEAMIYKAIDKMVDEWHKMRK